jgi:hypothetical protein
MEFGSLYLLDDCLNSCNEQRGLFAMQSETGAVSP